MCQSGIVLDYDKNVYGLLQVFEQAQNVIYIIFANNGEG